MELDYELLDPARVAAMPNGVAGAAPGIGVGGGLGRLVSGGDLGQQSGVGSSQIPSA